MGCLQHGEKRTILPLVGSKFELGRLTGDHSTDGR